MSFWETLRPRPSSGRMQSTLPQADFELVAGLRAVRGLDEVAAVLEARGLWSAAGLAPDAVTALVAACRALWAQGLGLEPNLAARACVRLIDDPARAGAAALQLAGSDGDFKALVATGDGQRDRHDFEGAQFSYWKALELYPAHPGYRVQYAHCLKERGLAADALVNYLDAWRHGAPLPSVQPHAEAAARAIGRPIHDLFPAAATGGEGLDRVSTVRPVVALWELFLGRGPSQQELAAQLIRCPQLRDVVQELLIHPSFAAANRDLLTVLSRTPSPRKPS